MSKKKKRLPYLKVYPGDEMQAPAAGCSMAAQGLWFRLRLIMHSCEPYGFLCPGQAAMSPEEIAGTFAGQGGDIAGTILDIPRNPPSDARLARMCAITVNEYLELCKELDEAGVTRYSRSRVMYCEGLVQDAIDRAYWASNKRKQRDLPLGYSPNVAGHSRDKRETTDGQVHDKREAVPALSSGYSYSYSNKEGARPHAKKRKPSEAERREDSNAQVAESFVGRGRS